MGQEENIAHLNQDFFLREFTYSNTKFRAGSGQELELCDGAVWLDDLLILFQAKSRNRNDATADVETESKWFKSKVGKKAVNQLADSVRYLTNEKTLPMFNRRGQELDLSGISAETTHLVAIYEASPLISDRTFLTKGRVSQRVGFVHFVSEGDYQAICMTLQTPMEVSQYLCFREMYVLRDPKSHEVSEKALVGKYLTDTDDVLDVCDEHEFITDRLINDPEEFSVSRMLHEYLERLRLYDANQESLQYHKILSVLAKLKRNVMKQFKQRLLWAMDKARTQESCLPSRMMLPYMDCSFLFLPLEQVEEEARIPFMERYALLCKQDLRSRLCLGIGVCKNHREPNDPSSFLVHWIHLEGKWEPHAERDAYLSKNPDCFREMRGTELGLYELN